MRNVREENSESQHKRNCKEDFYKQCINKWNKNIG